MADRYIYKTDLTSWYTTLNAIRSKHGLSTITVPTVGSADWVSASTISALITQIEALKSNAYLAYASYSDYSEVAVGSPVSLETADDFDANFDSLKTICTNDSTATNTTNSNTGAVCATSSYSTSSASNGTVVYNNYSTCGSNVWCKTNSDCYNAGNSDYTYSTNGYTTDPTVHETYDHTVTYTDNSNLVNSTNSTNANQVCSTYTDNANKVVTGNSIYTL